jgi:hypothetical protein
MSPSSTEKLGAHCESPEVTATTIAAPTDSEESWPTKDFGLIPIPKRLQYNPIKPFHFGILLNVSFGFASTFSTDFSVDVQQMLMARQLSLTCIIVNRY